MKFSLTDFSGWMCPEGAYQKAGQKVKSAAIKMKSHYPTVYRVQKCEKIAEWDLDVGTIYKRMWFPLQKNICTALYYYKK